MEKQASVKLATASLMIENGRNETAIDSLFSLVSEYGNTKSGRIGRFYLANAYYNQGQYEMAESKFREFISKGIDDPLLKSSAMNGVAACLEQKQLYDQAAAQYLKSARKYPDQIYASSSLYDAGRCYRLAGNNEKAKELFNELIKAYPESDETYKARTELAFLEENDSDTSVINVSP